MYLAKEGKFKNGAEQSDCNIDFEEFCSYFDSKKNFIKINPNEYGFSIDGLVFLKIQYIKGFLKEYCPSNYYHNFIIQELIQIASSFNISFYKFKYKKFRTRTPYCQKISARIPYYQKISHWKIKLFEKNAQCSILPQKLYSNVFFEQGEWLAIKCDVEKIVEYFDLELIEIKWENYERGTIRLDGYDDHSIIHHYNGWTFIRNSIAKFLKVKIEYGKKRTSYKWKIIHYLDCIKEKLVEVGSFFPEIHFYFHIEKYELNDAFFKVVNGSLKYGFCSVSEPYFNKSWCRKPKEIKELFSMDARYAASVWSVYPQELNFYSDFQKTEVWAVAKKDEL